MACSHAIIYVVMYTIMTTMFPINSYSICMQVILCCFASNSEADKCGAASEAEHLLAHDSADHYGGGGDIHSDTSESDQDPSTGLSGPGHAHGDDAEASSAHAAPPAPPPPAPTGPVFDAGQYVDFILDKVLADLEPSASYVPMLNIRDLLAAHVLDYIKARMVPGGPPQPPQPPPPAAGDSVTFKLFPPKRHSTAQLADPVPVTHKVTTEQASEAQAHKLKLEVEEVFVDLAGLPTEPRTALFSSARRPTCTLCRSWGRNGCTVSCL